MSKADIVSALRLLDRTIAYYPILGKVFGTSNAGIFVCQMLYWEGRQRDPEGWIRKSVSEIENEVGLSRHELDNVKRKLVASGVCEYKLIGSPPSSAWRFNWPKVNDLISDFAGVEEEKRRKMPPLLSPNEYEKRMASLIDNMKELEKANVKLQKINEELQQRILKEENPKPKPLPTVMAEIFDKYFQLYNPDVGKYTFQDKDFGQMKLLEKTLRARNLDQKINKAKEKQLPTDNIISTDMDVIDAWIYMLEHLPEWYRSNNMSPAALNSNLMNIVQQIRNEATARPKTNDTKTNKEDSRSGPFSTAIKSTGNDPK